MAEAASKPAPAAAVAASVPATADDAKKSPVARTSVETKHLTALLNGTALPAETVKKYKKLIARAEFSAQFDASN